eukprot:TRINITY_DN3417_c0_g1_i2.p1 TRINITY_DN3417_c0_g1~~TRINITY_DN3417_c0_g1_i2.p1  ORF type:complete len:284 (+),score=53.28 TRINITY_DN3417_c0_g1_i2:575-1426(+)
MVVFNSTYSMHVKKDISCRIGGREIVFWIESRDADIYYDRKRNIFSTKDKVLEFEDNDKVIDIGAHSWNFKFKLPKEGLSSSFENQFGDNRSRVEYYITSTIPVVDDISKNTFLFFDIVVPDNTQLPLEDTKIDRKERVEMTAIFNKRSVYVKEFENTISFRLKIQNKSYINWTKVIISVKEYQKQWGDGDEGESSKKWSLKKLKQKHLVYFDENGISESDYRIDMNCILNNIRPSMKTKNIWIKHGIKIALKTSKGHKKKKCHITFPFHVGIQRLQESPQHT